MGTHGRAPHHVSGGGVELGWTTLGTGVHPGSGGWKRAADRSRISLPTSKHHRALLPFLPPGWHRKASSITFWHLDCSCG